MRNGIRPKMFDAVVFWYEKKKQDVFVDEHEFPETHHQHYVLRFFHDGTVCCVDTHDVEGLAGLVSKSTLSSIGVFEVCYCEQRNVHKRLNRF